MLKIDEDDNMVITRIINGESVDIPLTPEEVQEVYEQRKDQALFDDIFESMSEFLNTTETEKYLTSEYDDYLIELVDLVDESMEELFWCGLENAVKAAMYKLDKYGLSSGTQDRSGVNYIDLMNKTLNSAYDEDEEEEVE